MVEREASLHESTVKAAEEHAGSFSRPRRRAVGPRSSRVTTVAVDPQVMAAARQLAAARPGTRVRVLDSGTVIVENDPTT